MSIEQQIKAGSFCRPRIKVLPTAAMSIEQQIKAGCMWRHRISSHGESPWECGNSAAVKTVLGTHELVGRLVEVETDDTDESFPVFLSWEQYGLRVQAELLRAYSDGETRRWTGLYEVRTC